MSARAIVVVISGPPGAGKSTVAKLVATRQGSPSACLESDWFWTTITNCFIPPWEPASDRQNRTVIGAVAAAAAEMADGGFPVVVESVVGPWHLPILVEGADAAGSGAGGGGLQHDSVAIGVVEGHEPSPG